MLDVESDDSGILIPRVALTAANVEAPVVDAQVSEMIYNTATAGSGANAVSPGFYYWNGSLWVGLTASAAGGDDKWNLLGNAGTTSNNFVGTTDSEPLRFRTNNTVRLVIPNANQIHANTRGTRGAPFYSFAADPDTGIFSPGPDGLDLVTKGETRLRVGNDVFGQDFNTSFLNHRFADGGPDYPSISFREQPNMGLYYIGSHVIGFSSNSKERMRVSDDGVAVKGALLLREGPAFNLSNGSNLLNLLSRPPLFVDPYSQYRITGPTGAFSIRGIIPLSGVGSPYLADRPDGYVITLINTTAHPLTILHNDSSAAADQRIYCPGENNFVLTGKYATVTLQYNMTLEKWVVVDYAGNSGAGGSTDNWSLTGNMGTNPSTHFVGTTDAQALQFKTNNTSRFVVPNANQVHAMNGGTAALPFYSWGTNNNTGMFLPALRNLGFSTNGTERMRMDANGAVGIGTSTPSVSGGVAIDKLNVQGSATFNGTNFTPVSVFNNTGPGAALFVINSGNSSNPALEVGTNTSNGIAIRGLHTSAFGSGIGVYGGSNSFGVGWAGYFNGDVGTTGDYFYVSDSRWKSNITPLKKKNDILEKVMKLSAKSYNWRAAEFPGMGFNPDKTSFGFIAQELKEVFPELVTSKSIPDPKKKVGLLEDVESVPGYFMVDYNGLIPVLTEAIQAQQEIINSQEERISKLESLVQELLKK